MIIGSHNAWSYLPARRWWMKPIAFMARCQSKTIQEQYALGVRCFDLRVRFNKYGLGIVAHGPVEYCLASKIYEDLAWLDEQGDCMVRVVNEVRTARQYRQRQAVTFRLWCARLEQEYPGIRFWCGRNLYDWERDYDFTHAADGLPASPEPSCDEQYASVRPPRLIDDWWPWLFARLHNRRIREQGTEADILLMDFVDIK